MENELIYDKENTYSDPFDEEVLRTGDEEKQLEMIQNLEDPEEIKKAMEALDETKSSEENKGSGDETDSNNAEPTTKKNEDEPSKVADDNKEKTNAPIAPEQPEKAEDKVNGPFVITDDYIAKADPKDKHILESLKGETLSPKALDIAINAQRMIGKKAEEIRRLKNPETDVINTNQNAPQKTAEPDNTKGNKVIKLEDPEVLTEIDSMVISKLQEDFKDLNLPSDPEEFNRVVSNLHYENTFLVDKIKAKKQSYETDYRQQFERVINFRDNYETENRKIVEKDIAEIQNYAKEVFGVELKELGYDLSLDNNGSNPIIDSLMIGPDGNSADPNVVKYGKKGTVIEGIPVMESGGIYNKFFRTEGAKIVNAIKKQALTSGYTTATKAKDELVNSLSDGTTKGENITRKENLTEEDIEKIEDPEAIKQILANIVIK